MPQEKMSTSDINNDDKKKNEPVKPSAETIKQIKDDKQKQINSNEPVKKINEIP